MPFIPGSPGMPSGPAPTGGAAPTGPRSLVLTAASSQYLGRTWANAPTNNKIFTLSYWFKRLSSQNASAMVYDGGPWNGVGSNSVARFTPANVIEYIQFDNPAVSVQETDATAYTDITTWHHVCMNFDTTSASPTVRRNFWIDGVFFTLGTDTFPGLNQIMHFADNGLTSAIGREQTTGAALLDAKLAYMYLIDGQQVDRTNFITGTGPGTTHPITYVGTFGTNGFFLDFRGNNANDQSGNGNNWTPNNSPTFSTDLPT